MNPIIQSIFVGQPKTITDERGTWTSSIYRDPVNKPVTIQISGLVGDKVTQSYHGGPDAAICVYVQDNYQFWNAQYNMNLPAGSFGENFTLAHINEDDICVGDIVRVGTAVIQVTGPRIPCANLARRIGRPDWVKLTIRENRTGFYMRVLESGTAAPGDAWNLQERLNPTGTIPAINRCFYLDFDPDFAKSMLTMQDLPDWYKEQIAEKLHNQTHWTSSMKD